MIFPIIKLSNKNYYLVIAIAIAALQSCQTLKQSPKFGFVEGYYKSRIHHKKLKKVYVVPEEDSIKVYTKKEIQRSLVDTLQSFKIAFPANKKPEAFESYTFRQNTFDIDIITILLRYRPPLGTRAYQFSPASFNTCVYFGYRTDSYHLHYIQTPLGTFKRNITHYGFSLGGFTGLGSVNINNGNVTQNAVPNPYDAIINITGLAAFVVVERFTYGVSLGYDHLLDKNRKLWVYQGQLWFGLTIGLNIH